MKTRLENCGSVVGETVCVFDGKTFTQFPSENGRDLVDVMFAIEDAAGNFWFGGRRGLLWRYDGETLTDFTKLKR